MSVRHSARSLGPLISTRSAMPSIEKSASWRWTWIFASGYTSSWGYLYPKGTDISNERGFRQGRKASPVSEQSPPEQTAWDSQKHILLQAQGRRKPEKSEDDGPSWISNIIVAQLRECARWWIISKAKDTMSGRNL